VIPVDGGSIPAITLSLIGIRNGSVVFGSSEQYLLF
jgi:hypothetical protein